MPKVHITRDERYPVHGISEFNTEEEPPYEEDKSIEIGQEDLNENKRIEELWALHQKWLELMWREQEQI